LQRAIAVVSAAAFLIVAFAHTLHHFDAMPPAGEYLAGMSSADDGPDPTQKAAISVEHCHGCIIVAVPIWVQPALLAFLRPEFPPAGLDGLRDHLPAAETPPPISAI